MITLLILVVPYILYLAYIVSNDQGPVDYETFMEIGQSLIQGEHVYGENSYYPLPYIAVFAVFSGLPRSISMILWLGLPVLVAVLAVGFHPYVLLFAPLFSHFVGGQSSVFGLLGYWGYRRNLDLNGWAGGVFLALTALKPQLGIVPIGFAAIQWVKYIRGQRSIPNQLISFLLAIGFMMLPSLIFMPGWIINWLRTPRPLFSRAISAAVPRLLLLVQSPDSLSYWILWFALSALILTIVWRLKGASHPLDILLLTSFIVNPLVHDYDLIQIIPTIWGPWLPISAIVLSIPGWWTIATQYTNDSAWITFIIIAPGLLAAYIAQCRRNANKLDGMAGRCRDTIAPDEAMV